MTPLMVSIENSNVVALLFLHQSTDDYFKLGADGADASATGRNTGCPDTEDGGWCSRIPSVAEVRAQLESSDPPILPVFAIAGEDPLGMYEIAAHQSGFPCRSPYPCISFPIL